jgi:hypothetical protein
VIFQFAKNSTETAFIISSILGSSENVVFGKLCRGVTVSVQSMNDDTLKAIKRKNMEINKIADHLELSRKYNVPTYTEVILGLPEETLETWKAGIGKILDMGQDTIDVWFGMLLENSELNSLESRTKYGIKYIVAEDYQLAYGKEDYTGITEEVHLVTSTKTMSLDDMVDAYMFSWLVIHLHGSGYAAYFAKFCKHVLNVSFEKFYSTMTEKMKNHAEFNDHVVEFKRQIRHYLETGKLTDNFSKNKINAHSMKWDSGLWIYSNRDLVNNLAKECTKEFTSENVDWLSDLCDNFIYNTAQTFPKITTYPYDITTWTKQDTEYSILIIR